MFPVFTNAALLAGLAGITAPVLIHLLLRRRSQRMRFSTVQFFVKKDEQSMRRRKLRNLLLLSLRVLLFLLVVLAFAKPLLPNRAAAGAAAKRQQAIILLDTSASMQSTSAGETRWKRAKENAQQILSKLQGDDRAALVLCSSHSSTASGFVTPAVLARKLEDVQPSFGLADLSEGLQEARKVFATANPAFETTLHVVSDLQRPATQNLSSVPLPKDLILKISDLGDRFAPNVTVTDFRLEREGDAPPRVTITSFSDENYTALPYRLKIDGNEILSGTVVLASGTSTNVSLAVPALKPGWHSAEFVIEPKDGFALDDTRLATLLVPDPIRVLVVEPRAAQRAYLEESFFVNAALNPTAAGEVSPSRFTCEKVALEKVGTGLTAQPGQPSPQLIVLPAVKQISSAVAGALKVFVQNGGGLLLFLGESVSANAYNTELRDLLPAEIGRVEPAGETGWRVGKFTQTAPSLALFRDAANGNLALHEFTQRFSLKPRPEVSVLAEFNDAGPLIVERRLGGGRVILVNTSADTRWTDWQKHKSFVPWLHSTAFYLSGRNPVEQRETAPTFTSGAEVDLAVTLKQGPVKLHRAGTEDLALTADAEGVLRDVLLPTPGIYSLSDASGRELRRVAVNLPTVESDLTFGAPAETEQQVVRQTEEKPATLAAGLFGESPTGQELWRLLLLGALVFMIVEPLVANKTVA